MTDRGGMRTRRRWLEVLVLGASATLGVALPATVPVERRDPPLPSAAQLTRQAAEYRAEKAKTILELQAFRSETTLPIEAPDGRVGAVTLTDLNPYANGWYLLSFDGARPQSGAPITSRTHARARARLRSCRRTGRPRASPSATAARPARSSGPVARRERSRRPAERACPTRRSARAGYTCATRSRDGARRSSASRSSCATTSGAASRWSPS